MQVTKAQIIKALKTENISIGYGWTEHEDLPEVGNCHVCSVGAVLRSCKLPNNTISELCNDPDFITCPYSCDDDAIAIDEALERGDYFSALSMCFEGDPVEQDAKKALKRAIKLVQDHFPAKITIKESEVKKARLAAFSSLLYHAATAEECEGFEHPYSGLNPDDYTPAQKTKLAKAYAKFFKKHKMDESDD